MPNIIGKESSEYASISCTLSRLLYALGFRGPEYQAEPASFGRVEGVNFAVYTRRSYTRRSLDGKKVTVVQMSTHYYGKTLTRYVTDEKLGSISIEEAREKFEFLAAANKEYERTSILNT